MNPIIHSTVVVPILTLASYAIATDENNSQDAKELTPSIHFSVVKLSKLTKLMMRLKLKQKNLASLTSKSLSLAKKPNFGTAITYL